MAPSSEQTASSITSSCFKRPITALVISRPDPRDGRWKGDIQLSAHRGSSDPKLVVKTEWWHKYKHVFSQEDGGCPANRPAALQTRGSADERQKVSVYKLEANRLNVLLEHRHGCSLLLTGLNNTEETAQVYQ